MKSNSKLGEYVSGVNIEYLTVNGLKDAVEDKVTQVSIWIQKCKNANTTVWMKLKAQVDNDFMYERRFAIEFKKR